MPDLQRLRTGPDDPFRAQRGAAVAYAGPIDPRIRRFEQCATALALAAAFAFTSRGLATVWLVVLGLSLVAEPIAPLRRAGAAIASRFSRAALPVDAGAVRFATLAATAVLGVGVLLLWLGVGAVGWLCVLAVAAAAALAALTQLCLGCELYRMLRRRTRPAAADDAP